MKIIKWLSAAVVVFVLVALFWILLPEITIATGTLLVLGILGLSTIAYIRLLNRNDVPMWRSRGRRQRARPLLK